MSGKAWADLATRAKAGDNVALEELLREAQAWTQRVVLRRGWYIPAGGDMADLVQAGMVGMWQAVRDWRPGASPFRPFAAMCMIREIKTELRYANRRKFTYANTAESLDATLDEDESGKRTGHSTYCLPDTSGLSADPADVALDRIEREQKRELVRYLTENLSPLQRAALAVFTTGMSYAEVAAMVGKNEKAIDNALQLAKRKIRRRWQEALAQGRFDREVVA